MKKKDTSKPLMLYLAESIYFQLIKIKESDPQITKIELVERFLATKEFDEIKKGNFHDNLFAKIKENNFINFETGNKIPKETIDLLNLQKNTVIKQFKKIMKLILQKFFPLSNSQNAFGLVWRMCETYELWCKEIKKKN